VRSSDDDQYRAVLGAKQSYLGRGPLKIKVTNISE
jgi:hypothetical protein